MLLHMTQRQALRVWLPVCLLVPLGDWFVVVKYGQGVASAAAQMHAAAGFLVMVLSFAVHTDPLIVPRVSIGRAVVDSV